MPMPSPIALPSDLLQALSDEDAQEVVTVLGVNVPLLQQPHDDPFDGFGENESMAIPRNIENHHEFVTGNLSDNDESHFELDTVKIATDRQEAMNSRDHDKSEVVPPALRTHHEVACITIDEDEDEDEVAITGSAPPPSSSSSPPLSPHRHEFASVTTRSDYDTVNATVTAANNIA
jgi:hypothetical protein